MTLERNEAQTTPCHSESLACLGGEESASALLDLSAPERIVRLRERAKLYRHFFHPLTLRDWERFYAGFHAEALSAEGTYQFRSDSDRAACQLWDAKIKSVEGYGGADQFPLPQLRERMPARHKIAAVSLLQEAVPGDALPGGADIPVCDLMAEEIPVVLSANWNEQVFNRLVHYFRRPTQDDELRHRRLAVHSFEVAGARTKQTRILIPSKFRPLVDLYDSLIVRVEGYSLGIEPLASSAQAIENMDGVHKMVAVSLLFGESPEGDSHRDTEDTEKEPA